MTDLQAILVKAITSYVAESPLGRLKDIDGSLMWDAPLVSFADGDDPLFSLYKTVVGEFHLTPREAMATHPKLAAGAGPLQVPHVAVVSWVLPTAERTRRSNAEMTYGPSLRWNHTRFQGEDFNDSVRRHVIGVLDEMGYVAVAPVLSSQFKTMYQPDIASTWSERHVAYTAGLGTFSLSDGLITARGIAHRCGSVVFNDACVATPRPYSHYQEYCSFCVDGSCGACIDRCPAGAISSVGHDKRKCREFLSVTLAEWGKQPGFIGSYAACGLCQVGVPCEAGIPG